MAREDDLQEALDNTARQLKEMTRSPKPTYSIDGQSVSWSEHFKALMEAQRQLKEALIEAEGPYEVRSIGET